MTIKLNAKLRDPKNQGADKIAAVVYGPDVTNASIEVDYVEFKKVLKEAGESSLIELNVEGEKEKRLVLVHEIQRDPVEDFFLHVDFLQPNLKEETEAEVPLVFEGEAPAVKDLQGTLVKNMSEIEVSALPQNLPHEIKVSLESLKTFEDRILVKDLVLPANVKATANPEEIVALVAAQENVDEELASEIKENVEDVEKVEKEKKEEVVIEDEAK
ncbi:MAG TPA: 50S ribosomal protein L25 [Candidatus Staskawiczbacteria bacterium]|nr:50S ribosomal protein L25 [Candidatus Staskawiczbacteria bacterium]